MLVSHPTLAGFFCRPKPPTGREGSLSLLLLLLLGSVRIPRVRGHSSLPPCPSQLPFCSFPGIGSASGAAAGMAEVGQQAQPQVVQHPHLNPTTPASAPPAELSRALRPLQGEVVMLTARGTHVTSRASQEGFLALL